MARLRVERAALMGHLDRLPRGLVLTDQEGTVLLASAVADEITAARHGLFIQGGRLRAVHADQNTRLTEAIRRCDTNPESLAGRMAISRPAGLTPHWVLVMPAPASTTLAPGTPRPRAVVLIMAPAAVPEPDTRMLRDVFGLTATEGRLAALLVQGKSIEEARDSYI
jgi:hypothetical protein